MYFFQLNDVFSILIFLIQQNPTSENKSRGSLKNERVAPLRTRPLKIALSNKIRPTRNSRLLIG